MESADQTTLLFESGDGIAWRRKGYLIEPALRENRSGCAKVTALDHGGLVALGYRFDRRDPGLPIGNPATGGLLKDDVFLCRLENGGVWSPPKVIPTCFSGSVEASAPLTVMSSGDWAAPIANFPDW